MSNDPSNPAGPGAGRVAVVIPAYNHAAYVAEAVASAAAQGPCVSEIVVVDDGSKDDTAAVVSKIREPRLRLLRQANQGPSPARNAGWRATSADWVFFLDADDAIAPGALPALLQAGGKASPRAIPYGYEEVHGASLSGKPEFIARLSTRHGDLLPDIVGGYPATILISLIPRPWIEDVGGFDPSVFRGEDFDFAIRLAMRRQFVRVEQPVLMRRMHGTNRHREFGITGSLDCIEVIRRRFKGTLSPRLRLIRQRGIAYYRMEHAYRLRDRGSAAEARAAFLRAWLAYPFRVGNLRQWMLGR